MEITELKRKNIAVPTPTWQLARQEAQRAGYNIGAGHTSQLGEFIAACVECWRDNHVEVANENQPSNA